MCVGGAVPGCRDSEAAKPWPPPPRLADVRVRPVRTRRTSAFAHGATTSLGKEGQPTYGGAPATRSWRGPAPGHRTRRERSRPGLLLHNMLGRRHPFRSDWPPQSHRLRASSKRTPPAIPQWQAKPAPDLIAATCPQATAWSGLRRLQAGFDDMRLNGGCPQRL